MAAQDNITILRGMYDAFNNQTSDPSSLDPVTSTLAEDCEVVDVPAGATFRGPEGFKQWLLAWTTAFPDCRVEVTNLFATEDRGVVEFIGRGTHTGTLHSPAGDLPPSGRSMDLRLCDVYQFRNGKVTSHRTYYDAMGLLQQLGALPTAG